MQHMALLSKIEQCILDFKRECFLTAFVTSRSQTLMILLIVEVDIKVLIILSCREHKSIPLLLIKKRKKKKQTKK